MSKLFDLDYETRTFKPTVEWMAKRYDEANEKLFDGRLGKCELAIFTTGRGSRGATNGWFKLMGSNLYVNPITYKIFSAGTPLNYANFVELGKPRIELNGNKHGSEWAFMVTLVHEMCHYFTYLNGFRPKRCHGKEFNKIAREIKKISDGQIEVTARATPERSEQMIMDSGVPRRRRTRRVRLIYPLWHEYENNN